MNVEKTEAMWLGSKRNSNDKPLRVTWSNHTKVLGVVFSYDNKLARNLNFSDKITSLKQTLALWSSRDLTGIGRVLIVKTFGLSKFMYLSNMISVPIDIQNQFNSIVHNFIWKGPDKIKRSVLRTEYSQGGLKMVDIYSRIKTQKIMWLEGIVQL